MQTTLPYIARQVRQLAPFVLLSLLLHVALLFVIRPPTKSFSVARQHPIEVYFSLRQFLNKPAFRSGLPPKKNDNPARLQSPPRTDAVAHAMQPDATSPTTTPLVFNPQQLMESAKSIARDEARKTEQHNADFEKKKLSTPAASLEQYLKQPQKEIRLANGMLKIITDAGAVCFQAVPYFARDSAGVFGIPTSCP